MANHSCNLNCRVIPYEPEDWNNYLVLLVLVAMRDIESSEAITFQYKGSMWRLHNELSLLAPLGSDGFNVDAINPALMAAKWLSLTGLDRDWTYFPKK